MSCGNSSSPPSNPRKEALLSLDVDPLKIVAFRRKTEKLSLSQLKAYGDNALDAWEKRQSKVTITSATFEGGGTSGLLDGDPMELVKIYELLIGEREGLINPAEIGNNSMSGASQMGHRMSFRRSRVSS